MSNYQKPVLPAEWLSDYMLEKGYTKTQILEGAGLDKKSPTSNLKLMPYPNVLILLDFLGKAENNPNLGFDLSSNAQPGDLGPVTLLAYQTPTFKDFIDTLIQYQSLMTTAIDLHLNVGTIESEIKYNILVPTKAGTRIDVDYTLKMFVDMIKECSGSDWRPNRVNVSYSKPDDMSRLYEEYGENIKFDQPTNSIFFETKLLKTVINETDPELLELMKAEIHQMLSNYNNRTNDLFSKVRACIASSLASGNCNSVNIARQLNVSQRTLVRHLSSINTSLREIKADVIEELAKTALCKTHTSIYEIAIQMGFSETSSFDRMFKKKTGYTPIQFREKYVDIDYSSNRYF
ncbi:AraC family transcriptional regulator ligand-binding domain-containing protein [Alteromonas australica]|uniref:AraC family transcriptional regulator n=1 Tax=Alteromonas australica TaxID=589873 RepID=UPI003F67B25E